VLQFHPTCSLLAKNHINEHRNEKYRALRGVQFLRYKFSSASILNQILGNSRSIYHPVEGGCWHLEEEPWGERSFTPRFLFQKNISLPSRPNARILTPRQWPGRGWGWAALIQIDHRIGSSESRHPSDNFYDYIPQSKRK
jgi:hypothetical protein